MRILKGADKKQCPICNCLFEFEGKDTYTEFEHEGLVIFRKVYVICPCCRAKLLVHKQRA